MISNRTIKTEQPIIHFYYEDIISYIKTQKSILDIQNNSKLICYQILQHNYKKYQLIGQSIWNQFTKQNPWNQIWNNTFYSYCWPENSNILCMILHYATRTNGHLYRWTNQEHLKSPNCKLCDQIENMNHLFTQCKRNKRAWKHFQKYCNCLTPLQHLLTHSATSLPSKTKKLVLTLTITILTLIWKTLSRLQFDGTILPTTNTITNIKNDLKDIKQTHYKQHVINDTMHEFEKKFCINNALCTWTGNSLTLLL